MRGRQDTFVCPQSFADFLACSSNSSAEMVQCLRQKASKELILPKTMVCLPLGYGGGQWHRGSPIQLLWEQRDNQQPGVRLGAATHTGKGLRAQLSLGVWTEGHPSPEGGACLPGERPAWKHRLPGLLTPFGPSNPGGLQPLFPSRLSHSGLPLGDPWVPSFEAGA